MAAAEEYGVQPSEIGQGTSLRGHGIENYLRPKKNWHFVWVSLFSAIFVIVFAEILCRFIVFVGKPPLSSNSQYDTKFLVAQEMSPQDDNVVLCGDSLVKQGLYPELIEAKLQKINEHLKVVNLAVNGSNQQDAIAYLRYLRDIRKIRPRLVIFDFQVMFTGLKEATTETEGGNPRSYLFARKLNSRPSFSENLSIIPSDVSVLIRQRGAIKHFIQSFFSVLMKPHLYDAQNSSPLINFDEPSSSRCGMSPNHNLILAKDVVKRIEHDKDDLLWTPSPRKGNFRFNPEFYSPIITYCQQHQIPLMLVWLPHENLMYERYWYDRDHPEAWFRQRFEEHSKKLFVFPIFLNTLPQDSNYFFDYRHLSTYGCVKVSEMLSDVISLPKYRSLIEHNPYWGNL